MEATPVYIRKNYWNTTGRWMVFLLAATSILSLMGEFYHLCSMSTFVIFIFLPAMLGLVLLAIWDRKKGTCQLWRAVWIGFTSGLLAAVAYDIFRLPFVFSKEWHLT